MKRLKMIALVVALSPLLMGAGGGGAPPTPGVEKILKTPKYKATIVMDTHDFTTFTAGMGSVTTRQNRDDGLTSTVSFQNTSSFLSGFTLYGCVSDRASDPLNHPPFPLTAQGLTEARFVNVSLSALMGPFAAIQLMGQLGEVIAFDNVARPLRNPIITSVSNPRCSGSDGSPGPGVQIFDAVIQFVVPN